MKRSSYRFLRLQKLPFAIPSGVGYCLVIILGLFTSSIALGNHLDSHSPFGIHKPHEGANISLDPTLRRFLYHQEPDDPQPLASSSGHGPPSEETIQRETGPNDDPGIPPMERGWKYLLTGRPEAALRAYRQALQNQPDSDIAHLGLGMALKSLGNIEEAKHAITRALDLNPRFPSALVHLGYLYADGQVGTPDPEAARRLFQQASQIGDPFARIALLDLQARLSRQEFKHSNAKT